MLDKKLNKALEEVLEEPLDEMAATTITFDAGPTDRAHQKHDRKSPAYSDMPTSDEQLEPADKVMVALKHHLINGDYEKARELAKNKDLFSQHHMNQLINWVRNFEKYTNMTDLSKNYYNYDDKGKMDNVEQLKSKKVKEERLDRFMKDVEKVLAKKLAPK
jgi:hypothetical protein